MLDIAMPKIEILGANEQYGRFKIEPLDPGYGHTLGNALRRVLLSSIPGAAVSKIKIDGVYDPSATLEGIREDVTELVLNLKSLRVRTSSEQPLVARLACHGAGRVVARALALPAGVELVNPDHYVCTLERDDARLDVEVTIERGEGYVPADKRDLLPLGEIPVDAMFTPVPRVLYEVENTRIGQATDFDRLLIEVWTDGTVKPGDALSYAAQVLVQYSQTVADFNRVALVDDQPPLPAGPTIPPDVYDKAIEELELSTRTYNCLKRADITRVGQVLQMDEKALLSVRNLGQKSMEEIRDRLVERGYIARPLVSAASE
ncbi:MAG: DNA-directed RNA polymerase subunit alpha [Candidatus Viridilinea halotolerans]|uniref:DNA-directed RNA polymerase subunit alpha n=1 Tax=Candidatus Viridilinea halotolerans TaxID=2491704 RepID=A0A426TS52_9CHLR|nr:MAG: DNA-directed RNA polymerase subunit alpha [Candidatus Viridilinea halotolerans]